MILALLKKVSLFLLITSSLWAHVILIDPGHGGEEFGAIGKAHLDENQLTEIYEKIYALKLAKLIKKELDSDYKVYLTRSFDRHMTLEDRSSMTSFVKADILISIHFNSSFEESAEGFEIFYLDNHQDKAVKKVEDTENKQDGKINDIDKILIDLAITQTAPRSKQLASLILKNSTSVFKKHQIRNRGVRPGLFYVLALSKTPGVLIEAGFMSNEKELKKIVQSDYLKDLASSTARGIREYLDQLPEKDLNLF